MVNKALFKKVKTALSKEGSFDKRSMYPVRDWFIGLSIFLLIVIAGGVQSALVFVEYRNIEVSTSGVDANDGVSYNGSLVHLALEAYREKALRYDLPNEPAPVIAEPITQDPLVATSTATSSAEVQITPEPEEGVPSSDVILQ
jgi:hypothetical protein